jgi:hypothetical protein
MGTDILLWFLTLFIILAPQLEMHHLGEQKFDRDTKSILHD